MNDDEYFEKSKKIRIINMTHLLSELLYLNYKYNSEKNKRTIVENVYNESQNLISFSELEKQKIIDDSLSELKEKYGISSSDLDNENIKNEL